MSSVTPPEDLNVRTLYVGGIYRSTYTPTVEEKDIRKHLHAYGELESVMMVPTRSCAYVTFVSRSAAEKAAKDLGDNLEINGMRLKVTWGRLRTSVAHNQTVQPPRSAAGQVPRPPPVLNYVNVQLPSSVPVRHCCGSPADPPRMGAAIPSHEDSAVTGSGAGPENLVGRGGNSTEELPREESSFRLPVGTSAFEGPSGNPSIGGEQVEPRTMALGGFKRFFEEAMSPQEMRERVMKRKQTSTLPVGSSVVPPVSPPGLAQVGSAAEGESSEEIPLTRLVTSFPRDFLVEKSGVTTMWPDADALLFPGPMHLLEKKSDIELVNKATELSLHGVQVALMTRRRLLDQLGQQDVGRTRLAEAEAAEARMSSQLSEVAAEIQSLKEATAAAEARAAAAEARAAAAEVRAEARAAAAMERAEARAAEATVRAEARVAEAEAWAAAAVEARNARDALLITADAQLREMKEKMRLKVEEIREERKDAASSAGLWARAKLMREFIDGKSSSWDPQAEIDFYVAHIGEEADLVSKDTLLS